MSESQPPREIILETRDGSQNLALLQRVFQGSKIKAETVSSNPIRIKIPATTRAVSVLLLLLDELRPEGSIILDNGSSYAIDEEGLSKLRRIAIRSLSEGISEKDLTSAKPRRTETTRQVAVEEARPIVKSDSIANETLASRGFKSSEVTLLTMTFLLLIGVVAAFVTLLAVLGRIGEIYSVFIFGACVIGAFSVMHRYAGAFKESKS